MNSLDRFAEKKVTSTKNTSKVLLMKNVSVTQHFFRCFYQSMFLKTSKKTCHKNFGLMNAKIYRSTLTNIGFTEDDWVL